MRTVQKARAELRDFGLHSRKRLYAILLQLGDHATEPATFRDILISAVDHCNVTVSFLEDATELSKSSLSKVKNNKTILHLNHRKATVDAIKRYLATFQK